MSAKDVFSAYRDMRKYTVRHVDVDGKITFETRQDCEPIVEWVKAARDRKRDPYFTHVAEVPMSVIGQWMADGSLDDEAHVRRWLNNPDNRDFRVWEGRL